MKYKYKQNIKLSIVNNLSVYKARNHVFKAGQDHDNWSKHEQETIDENVILR